MGVELDKEVGSPRFKLLYDTDHMQIMLADPPPTIRDNFEVHRALPHGGVPGRHELDATQELQYPAIMRAIVELGYTGFVAQEFVPARDPLTSLREGYDVCNV